MEVFRPSPLPARLIGAALAVALAAGCAPHEAEAPYEADAVPDAYARPTGALVWPGTSRAWFVTPEGNLYNGDWQVTIRPVGNGVPAGPPKRIAAEDRWRPVLHWTRRAGPVRWDFSAVALPGVPARDTGLVVSLEATATNTDANAEALAALDLDLALPDTVPLFAAFDAEDSTIRPTWGSGSSDARVHGFCRGGGAGGTQHVQWTLPRGGSMRLRVVLPAYPERERDLAHWARTSHAACVERARRYWDSEVARGARFELGDPEVEKALDAARVVLLECRERRGAAWVPIGGPFHYRDIWLRDGARAVQALALLGYTDESRALAQGLLALQWPQGAFLTQRGQLDGTGQALWAFEQAALRPQPDTSVTRFAEAAGRAWRWSEWMRGMGADSHWAFGTLMPYAEPRDNELVRAQLTGNDAWMLAGYRAAESLLRAARRTAAADSVAASRAAYERDVRDALARSGRADVPPSWQGVGRDWGNLSFAYPCRVLEPGDGRMRALARRVWATAGGAGLLTYGVADSLQYYLGGDLATWALLAGERGAADSVLQAMLDWRSASGGAAELFSRSTRDFGRNVPPHATSAAALVTLVRNALVFDDGDTLKLTLGARGRWWHDGHVFGAPTRWGPIDLGFRRKDRAAQWAWGAVPVVTALTLPPGTELDGDPAPPLSRASATVVLAPPGTHTASVTVRETGARP